MVSEMKKRITSILFVICGGIIFIIAVILILLLNNSINSQDELWPKYKKHFASSIELVPLVYKNYSQTKTISKKLIIRDKDKIKMLQACINDKHCWFDYLDAFQHWSYSKALNMNLKFANGEEITFRICFYTNDNFVHYSELRNPNQPYADSQATFGGEKASKELASILLKIFKANKIEFLQVEASKTSAGSDPINE